MISLFCFVQCSRGKGAAIGNASKRKIERKGEKKETTTTCGWMDEKGKKEVSFIIRRYHTKDDRRK